MKTTNYKTKTPREAVLAGYDAISDRYKIPKEESLMKKALADLNGIMYLLVSDDGDASISIWRRKGEINTN